MTLKKIHLLLFFILFLFSNTLIIFSQVPTNGLVAYYPFNGNATDESGTGNNGLISGASLTINRFGNPYRALSFDGINDLITVGNNPSLNPGISNWSISGWIKTTDNNGVIISKSIGDSQQYPQNNDFYLVYLLNGNLVFEITDGYSGPYDYSLCTSTTTINNGAWHFFTIVLNRSTVGSIYIDGVFNNSVNISNHSGDISPIANLEIGYDSEHLSTYLNGVLDDIRMYNRALTPSEILLLYNETEYTINAISNNASFGTVSGGGIYFNGTTITLTANANNNYTFVNWTENGTVVSTNPNYTFVVTTNRNLVANFAINAGQERSLSFTSGNYVRIPSNPIFANHSSITVEFWFFYQGGEEENIIGVEKEYAETWRVSIYRNELEGGVFEGSTSLFLGYNSSNIFYSTNQWQHIAMVYDNNANTNQLKIFVNGILQASLTGRVNFVGNSGQDIVINRHIGNSGSSSRLTGKIDELRISNSARYTSNFLPPTSPFINDINTMLLYHFNEASGNNIYDASSYGINGTIIGTMNRSDDSPIQNQSNLSVSTSSNPVNGGTTSGSGIYNSGSGVTVTASPNSGYTFTNWTENGIVVSTNSSYTFIVTTNRNLVANFAINTYTLTINAVNGSVTKNPNQSTYSYGTQVQLTATPTTGYSFTGWSGDASGTTNPLIVTMTSNKIITANFSVIQQYIITTNSNPSNGGTTSGGGTYNSGSSVTVTATPNSGYTFTNWTENGNVVSTNSNYTFVVTLNRNLVANFQQSSSTNPSIKPTASSLTVNKGAEFWIEVKVGDPNTVGDLFGISFKLSSNNAICSYVDGSAENGGFLGTSSSVIFFPRKVDNQTVDIAVSKMSGSGSNGYGVVARAKFVASSSISSDQNIIFSLSDVVANNSTGGTIAMSASTLGVMIIAATAVNVWPGDCNNDKVVNSADIIPIGLYYGQSRPGSNNPGSSWQIYPREPWNSDGNSPSRIHADADGSGIINSADIIPIGLNYSKTHASIQNNEANTDVSLSNTNADATIKPVMQSSVRRNVAFTIQIKVGDPNPIQNLFGISFKLMSNKSTCTYVDGSAENGGFLGASSSVLFFPRKVDEQTVDMAVAKMSGSGSSGSGIVTQAKFISSVDQLVTFSIVDVVASNSTGGTIPMSILSSDITVDVVSQNKIPTEYSLSQNFPNPFNPITTIQYSIPEQSFVSVKIYDSLGKEIQELVRGEQSSGNYEIKFDGSNLPSGIYFYQMRAAGFVDTKKILLLR